MPEIRGQKSAVRRLLTAKRSQNIGNTMSSIGTMQPTRLPPQRPRITRQGLEVGDQTRAKEIGYEPISKARLKSSSARGRAAFSCPSDPSPEDARVHASA